MNNINKSISILNKAEEKLGLVRFRTRRVFLPSLFALLMILFFNMQSAYAQATQINGRPIDSMRLFYLNEQYIQSWIKSDTAIYNKLLWAKEFVHLSSGKGKFIPRKALADVFGVKRFDEISFFYADSVQIRFINDSIAFVYAVTPYLGKNDTQVEYSRYNDVYIKHNNEWKCIAANTVNINRTNFKFNTISSLPEMLQLSQSVVVPAKKEEVELLKENRDWIKKLLDGSDTRNPQSIAYRNWYTNVDGSLHKNDRFKIATLQTQFPNYSLLNESVSFITNNFAIARVAIINDRDNRKIGMQVCNYFYQLNSKWVLVSSNATALKD